MAGFQQFLMPAILFASCPASVYTASFVKIFSRYLRGKKIENAISPKPVLDGLTMSGSLREMDSAIGETISATILDTRYVSVGINAVYYMLRDASREKREYNVI